MDKLVQKTSQRSFHLHRTSYVISRLVMHFHDQKLRVNSKLMHHSTTPLRKYRFDLDDILQQVDNY